MPRILVTGASGQVGGELLRTLAPLGEIIAPTRAELDLANPTTLPAYLQSLQPRWIVNAAAYTAVDRAESEPALAETINSTAPRILAEQAHLLGATLIHFSTDYVFDGQSPRPYLETDPTAPLGVYGATKLAGEQAILAATNAALILRTSWVFGAKGNNFLRTILKLARQRQELRIVADQHGAPTWSRDLAHLAAHLIARTELTAAAQALTITEAAAQTSGIYHASGSGETTWHGFASEAVTRLKAREPDTPLAAILPIPSAEYPTPARRPQNSRLNCRKLQDTFAWTMPDWHDSMKSVLADPDLP